MMIKNISFISAHFYDFDWTELLVRNIKRYTDEALIKEIILINQDRTQESRDRLQALDPKVRVVEYPRSELHYKMQWHDHAWVLNNAIYEAGGDFICIFDSDAHPFDKKWIEICNRIFKYYDAILALQPGKVILTHPCFMFIKNFGLTDLIKFDDGMETAKIDVGRRVGIQLLEHGKNVYFASHKDTFLGQWGRSYLDVIYHHQSGSFHGSQEEGLKLRVKWQIDYFKNLVVDQGRYKFSIFELVKYILYRIFHSVFRKSRKRKLPTY